MKTTYSGLFKKKGNGRVVQHQKVYNAQRPSILIGHKILLQIFKKKRCKTWNRSFLQQDEIST